MKISQYLQICSGQWTPANTPKFGGEKGLPFYVKFENYFFIQKVRKNEHIFWVLCANRILLLTKLCSPKYYGKHFF